MTPSRDDVIRMAREAGMDAVSGGIRNGKYEPKVNALKHSVPIEWLERFAALVAESATAAEREGCALAVEIKVARWSSVDDDTASALQAAAGAIRARSTKP